MLQEWAAGFRPMAQPRGGDEVYVEEKERGRRIARYSAQDRNALIARLMFGEDWPRARNAMALLMESWGIAAQPTGERGREERWDGE